MGGSSILVFWQAFCRRHRELGRPSFPRKREPNAEAIAGAWIPACAGMTAPNLTVGFGSGSAALRYIQSRTPPELRRFFKTDFNSLGRNYTEVCQKCIIENGTS